MGTVYENTSIEKSCKKDLKTCRITTLSSKKLPIQKDLLQLICQIIKFALVSVEEWNGAPVLEIAQFWPIQAKYLI